LELPLEIRQIIYQHAFTPVTKVIGSRHLRLRQDQERSDVLWRQDRRNQRAPLALGLLRASHQVYHEALEYLYSSPNTIIIASSKMLEYFLDIPGPLERCLIHNCERPTQKPVIENAIFYPKEFDLAFSSWDPNVERIVDYLPRLGAAGGIRFKHLTLDISQERIDFGSLLEALTTSNISVLSTFTLRGWSFLRELRLWVKSRDCIDVIEHLGLNTKPTLIAELPLNMVGERTSWKIRWSSEEQVDTSEDAETSEESLALGMDNNILEDLDEPGQWQVPYDRLRHFSFWDAQLDMSKTFPKCQIVRMGIEKLV
jgi:hypothetical protein